MTRWSARHERRASAAVTLTVNGCRLRACWSSRAKLLCDVLREDCGLTGTHVGCEHGVCGACTVLVDGRPARSCLIYAVQAAGPAITTIEAFAAGRQAFGPAAGAARGARPAVRLLHARHRHDHGGLARRKSASRPKTEIREALSGNLCRCTGYHNIVAAVAKAAARRRKRDRAMSDERTSSAQPLLRKEDYRFLTGQGRYLDDIVFPGALHAHFVRSPHAHARIVSIDCEAARAAGGCAPS